MRTIRSKRLACHGKGKTGMSAPAGRKGHAMKRGISECQGVGGGVAITIYEERMIR